VLEVVVPLLEAPLLLVAWLLSLVVLPVLMPMQLVVVLVPPVVWLLFWVALVTPTRSVVTTRVLEAPVPLLEAPLLLVAWLLSLAVLPVLVPVPMQRVVVVVLPMVWLLSWVALANEITTRATTPPTPMPM
jgi:hypothetical protein